jgi:protoporphyrinogen oxidase
MENLLKNHLYDCIVIGGGISGVSFAHYLRREGHSVLILEKERRLGGRIHSAQPEKGEDFWMELGAHTCYNSYTELLSLIKEIGKSESVVPLASVPYKLYSGKKIRSIFSEISLLPLLLRFWKIFSSSKNGKTTREYFEPIVGRSNYKKLFSKLFRAVISQEADEYPAEIFLKKRAQKDETVARRFSYRGGLSALVEDIANESGAEILNYALVENVEKQTDGLFKVFLQNGQIFTSRHIAIATDITTAPLLLSGLNLDQMATLTATIRPSRSIAVNVVVDKQYIRLKKMGGIIPLSNDFFSAVSGDAIDNEHWRSFTFHFPESKLSPAERLEIVLRTLGITDNNAIHTETYRHALPKVRLQHLQLAEKSHQLLQDNRIFLLGNYFHGMSIEDCVRRSKEEAARFEKEF